MQLKQISARDVKTLPPGRYTIGDGLRLHVVDDEHRYWVLRYTENGKRRDKGLGSAMLVPLSAAKAKAMQIRLSLAQGKPIDEKESIEVPTFAQLAPEAVENFERVRRWKNAKHRQQWLNTLSTYAFPILGEMRVDQIERDDVLQVLLPIWETKAETASRVRGRIEAVLDYAKAKGFRSGENPAGWRGNLDAFLPRSSTVQDVEHHKAMTFAELRDDAPKLFASQHTSILAVTFGVLTAARAQEILGATWGEIDLETATWSIGADRMKNKEPHRVPLSAQALDILRRMRPENPSPGSLVFPSPISGKKMAIDSLRQCLRMATHTDVTMHGMRSTFRDWCEENFIHQSLAERALSHVPSSKVVRAYQRSDLLEQRRPVMQQWADAILPDFKDGK